MRNVELKARLWDWAAAVDSCQALAATPQGEIHQVDIYFRVPEGRLKLRQADPGNTELIFYQRPDGAGPRTSEYLVAPATSVTGDLLSAALGVLGVAEKRRVLWLWKSVRIHLDRVEGLGEFIEFEAVVSPRDGCEECARRVGQLCDVFGISEEDLIGTSYLDMILAAVERP